MKYLLPLALLASVTAHAVDNANVPAPEAMSTGANPLIIVGFLLVFIGYIAFFVWKSIKQTQTRGEESSKKC